MTDPSPSQDLPSPEQYQAFLKEVELRGARLVSCNVEASRIVHDTMQVSYEIEVESTLTPLEEGFEAIQECAISFFADESGEERADPVSHILRSVLHCIVNPVRALGATHCLGRSSSASAGSSRAFGFRVTSIVTSLRVLLTEKVCLFD